MSQTSRGIELRMTTGGTTLRCGLARRSPAEGLAPRSLWLALLTLWAGVAGTPARAADPAVVFMAQVGRELTAAARTRSPGVMANVIQRYGDVRVIGNYSLGAYRARLAE